MLAMAGAAWGGVIWLVTTIPPSRPLALPLFYILAFSGIANSAALLAWLALRPRVHAGRLRTPAGYVGHSMLLASIALFALWLQTLGMLTLTAALLLFGLDLFLELALLFGTRGSVEIAVEPHASSAIGAS